LDATENPGSYPCFHPGLTLVNSVLWGCACGVITSARSAW
jgi:hypothetical protein